MTFKPLKLPYSDRQLEPYLNQQQLKIHYELYYLKYVEVVNELCKQLNIEASGYEDLIVSLHGNKDPDHLKLYRSACQAYNHELYWHSLSDDFYDLVDQYDHLHEKVVEKYDSTKRFLDHLTNLITSSFGSNWITLIYRKDKQEIEWMTYHDEGTPFTDKKHDIIPLLTVDVWEHSFGYQHKNDKKAYAKAMITLLNWKLADQILSSQKSG